MKTSDNGVDLIKGFEGFRSHPYLDSAGVPTIGYGSTYYLNGASVTMSDDLITEPQAASMMKLILAKYEQAVTRYVQTPINQNQFDALVSFTYNVGMEALRKSTLLKKLNKGLHVEASKEFKKWVYAGGNKLKGLENRREKEKIVFLMPVVTFQHEFKEETQPKEKQMLNGYKTYIGIAITILGSLSGLFGWDLGDLAGLQDQLIVLFGAIIAIYGRYVAKPKDA